MTPRPPDRAPPPGGVRILRRAGFAPASTARPTRTGRGTGRRGSPRVEPISPAGSAATSSATRQVTSPGLRAADVELLAGAAPLPHAHVLVPWTGDRPTAGPVDEPLAACWPEPGCDLRDDPSTMRMSTGSSLGEGVPTGTSRTSRTNIAVTGLPGRSDRGHGGSPSSDTGSLACSWIDRNVRGGARIRPLTCGTAPPTGLESIAPRVDPGALCSGWSASNVRVSHPSGHRPTLVSVGRRGWCWS
jgi:hypothetical protein